MVQFEKYCICDCNGCYTENKKMKRPRDTNKLAKAVVDIATGQAEDTKPKTTPKRANGGYARARSVSSERRQEIARTAAAARWGS